MNKIYIVLLPLFLLIGFVSGWWVFDTKSERKSLHFVTMDIIKSSNNLLQLRDVIEGDQNINTYEKVLVQQLVESTNILGHLLMQNELELEDLDKELLSSVFQVTPELKANELPPIDSHEDLSGIQYVKNTLDSP